MSTARPDPFGGVEFDGSFAGTEERQRIRGLELEPIERLRWLERTLAEMRRLQELARAQKH
ncbi:MAG TPA: hypothetical protein VEK79_20250 [Thermoanaerobaculia bacterium]|nr:hypothetical protein [Thermoanaerobaculia bacterium]